MNILIINGSPKGDNSITLHTLKYLQALHQDHEYQYLNVGQKIKALDKDFAPARLALSWADLIIFSYPVYTFIAPSPIHKFIELIKLYNVNLKDKLVSQVTTSKHFFDMTAHEYIKACCLDLKMKYFKGFSADMDDLLTKDGQKDANDYFLQLMLDIQNENYDKTQPYEKVVNPIFISEAQEVKKDESKTIALVSCYGEEDTNMNEMVKEFKARCPYKVEEYDIYNFHFHGGCLGCYSCTSNGHCIYHDDFENMLKNQIQKSDAIVYAFPIKNHYTYYQMKVYDDRQFVNGHRNVTKGKPVGYLISGDLSREENLKVIIKGRIEVGGNYLCHIVNDKDNPSIEINTLIANLNFAFKNKPHCQLSFYGDGGNRIFRDLIYVMRGFMRQDHRFYKQTKLYNTLPQRHLLTMIKMEFIGLLMKSNKVKIKMRDKMNKYIIAPYDKVVSSARKEQNE